MEYRLLDRIKQTYRKALMPALAATVLYGSAVAAPQIVGRKFAYQNNGQDISATVTLAPAAVAKGKKAKAPTAFRIYDPATKTVIVSAENLEQSGSLYTGSAMFPGSTVGPEETALQIWAEDGKITTPKTEKLYRTKLQLKLKPYVPPKKKEELPPAKVSSTAAESFFGKVWNGTKRAGNFVDDTGYIEVEVTPRYAPGQKGTTLFNNATSNTLYTSGSTVVLDLKAEGGLRPGKNVLAVYFERDSNSVNFDTDLNEVHIGNISGPFSESMIGGKYGRIMSKSGIDYVVSAALGTNNVHKQITFPYDILDITKTDNGSGLEAIVEVDVEDKDGKVFWTNGRIVELVYKHKSASGKSDTDVTINVPGIAPIVRPTATTDYTRTSHEGKLRIKMPFSVFLEGTLERVLDETKLSPQNVTMNYTQMGAGIEWRPLHDLPVWRFSFDLGLNAQYKAITSGVALGRAELAGGASYLGGVLTARFGNYARVPAKKQAEPAKEIAPAKAVETKAAAPVTLAIPLAPATSATTGENTSTVEGFSIINENSTESEPAAPATPVKPATKTTTKKTTKK